MPELGVFEAILTNRQFTRYKPDAVPRADLIKLVEAASKAPSGGNRQPWEFIIVDDPALVKQIGELYKEAWLSFGNHAGEPIEEEPDPQNPDRPAALKQARSMAMNMPNVPAMIVVCADHSRSMAPYVPGEPIVRGRENNSLLFACQLLFVAARGLNLGTRFTSSATARPELRKLIGIPEYLEPVCITPVGYPKGNFGPANRRPVQDVCSINTFGNRPTSV